jgi:hypothetical protein
VNTLFYLLQFAYRRQPKLPKKVNKNRTLKFYNVMPVIGLLYRSKEWIMKGMDKKFSEKVKLNF